MEEEAKIGLATNSIVLILIVMEDTHGVMTFINLTPHAIVLS